MVREQGSYIQPKEIELSVSIEHIKQNELINAGVYVHHEPNTSLLIESSSS
jgi:hypothetical protein